MTDFLTQKSVTVEGDRDLGLLTVTIIDEASHADRYVIRFEDVRGLADVLASAIGDWPDAFPLGVTRRVRQELRPSSR